MHVSTLGIAPPKGDEVTMLLAAQPSWVGDAFMRALDSCGAALSEMHYWRDRGDEEPDRHTRRVDPRHVRPREMRPTRSPAGSSTISTSTPTSSIDTADASKTADGRSGSGRCTFAECLACESETPSDGHVKVSRVMSARRVVVGLHWPNEDFGDSAAWQFDPGRVYRQASRRGRNPWGLWTSPKTSANGWNRCTAARELGSIGDHHREITVDITGMLRVTAEQDVPAEFG